MTTHTYSSPLAHNSNANFRAWGLELSGALTTVGFPKSADTGQINWATVNMPMAANTVAGYEIRYLNDSLHGSKPIYLKIEYGTINTSLQRLGIWVSAASATNGSGTLSGTTYLTRRQIIRDDVSGLQVGNYPTYVCALPGYLAFAFKRRAKQGNLGTSFFSLCRTCDSAGVPTSSGFYFYYNNETTADLERTTYITSEVNDTSLFCLFPGAATTTQIGADVQAIKHFGYTPEIKVIPFFLSYLESEIGSESTFTATPVGVTPRTYLTLGGTGAPVNCSATKDPEHKLAMQFE